MTENQEIIQLFTYLSEIITIKSFIKATIIYLFIIWIAIVIWVIKDITNRTDSIILQFLATLIVVVLGPFGIFIYLLFRPTKTLFEKHYEEIEYNIEYLGNSIVEKIENKLKKKKENKEKNIMILKDNISKVEKIEDKVKDFKKKQKKSKRKSKDKKKKK